MVSEDGDIGDMGGERAERGSETAGGRTEREAMASDVLEEAVDDMALGRTEDDREGDEVDAESKGEDAVEADEEEEEDDEEEEAA
jgi:hypothetical protein